ncbi:hypothetical protein KIN20_018645 [Parelaphostrongylus tenuis]|uniref:Myb-like domain-containing protein n=1 Tax=Parelaphostrongylus tenuis TaxID=148309 RepID=A0AAD5QRP1_PARTN|nr:hypothetical protein KIN20_018645 [Parelaphostrongylus tenuis]
MPNPRPRMPKSGLYNDDGFLFHHVSVGALSLDEIERLRDHGIPYEPRTRFTPAEDEQIRKNWKRFAEKNGVDYNMALYYAGVPGYKMFSSREERLEFNRTTSFWPKLCHDLPHRCASQVRRRMGTLFDDAILSGHADIPYSRNVQWTLEETEQLLQHYKTFGLSYTSIRTIGKLMNRPALTCRNHLLSVLAHSGPVPDFLWKRLWILTMKHTVLSTERKFDRIIRKAIRRGRVEECYQYDRDIPWNIIAPKIVYSIDFVKDAWHKLLLRLSDEFREKRQQGKSRRESWVTALNSIFATVPPISCEDFSGFLRILSHFTPDDTAYHLWSRRLYNCDLIKARLEEEGIVGFYCGNKDELRYLFSKTQAILWRVNVLLFRRLRLPYSLKERTHILSLAYDYQCGFSATNGASSVESTEHKALSRYHFKSLDLKRCGFPVLHRGPFVEALIVYSVNHFDDWIPPTALKKYVKSEEVLSLFPERKNNSELIRQSDLNTAVSFLDLDMNSETSGSDSDLNNGDGV